MCGVAFHTIFLIVGAFFQRKGFVPTFPGTHQNLFNVLLQFQCVFLGPGVRIPRFGFCRLPPLFLTFCLISLFPFFSLLLLHRRPLMPPLDNGRKGEKVHASQRLPIQRETDRKRDEREANGHIAQKEGDSCCSAH